MSLWAGEIQVWIQLSLLVQHRPEWGLSRINTIWEEKSRLFSPLPTENPLGEGLQQQIFLSKILRWFWCTLKTEATALGNAGTDEHLCRHIWKSSKGKHSMSGRHWQSTGYLKDMLSSSYGTNTGTSCSRLMSSLPSVCAFGEPSPCPSHIKSLWFPPVALMLLDGEAGHFSSRVYLQS